MEQQKKQIPLVESRLRHNILEMSKEIRQASGIAIYGRRIKSLVFTTDLAIIKNCDADAVLRYILSHHSNLSAMLLSRHPAFRYFAE